jgi:methylmalonyl-CoA mutase cobalamin-binding subunit
MMSFLGRNELLNAFELLDDELGRMGVEADLFVVGGAAMAVAYEARRATTDVDAVFAPSKEVRTAASRVAKELGLEEDWLNACD